MVPAAHPSAPADNRLLSVNILIDAHTSHMVTPPSPTPTPPVLSSAAAPSTSNPTPTATGYTYSPYLVKLWTAFSTMLRLVHRMHTMPPRLYMYAVCDRDPHTVTPSFSTILDPVSLGDKNFLSIAHAKLYHALTATPPQPAAHISTYCERLLEFFAKQRDKRTDDTPTEERSFIFTAKKVGMHLMDVNTNDSLTVYILNSFAEADDLQNTLVRECILRASQYMLQLDGRFEFTVQPKFFDADAHTARLFMYDAPFTIVAIVSLLSLSEDYLHGMPFIAYNAKCNAFVASLRARDAAAICRTNGGEPVGFIVLFPHFSQTDPDRLCVKRVEPRTLTQIPEPFTRISDDVEKSDVLDEFPTKQWDHVVRDMNSQSIDDFNALPLDAVRVQASERPTKRVRFDPQA